MSAPRQFLTVWSEIAGRAEMARFVACLLGKSA
jgi:hypothetical protein